MKKNLKPQELYHFFEPLGLVLHSGISLSEGLQLMKEDTPDPQSQALLTALIENLEQTGSFHEAMKHCECFPDSAMAYIKVGEETGRLEEVLNSLTQKYEQEISVTTQIRNAVQYPILMLGMMALIILLLLIKVLPVFEQVFQQMGMTMNGVSGALLRIGSAFRSYSYIFFFLLALLIAVLLFLALTEKGRSYVQSLLQKLPYLRKIPLAFDYAHLSQGLSMGLSSGLDPLESMKMAQMLVHHPLTLTRMEKAISILEEGGMFTDAMCESELFSGMDARLIQIGYRTGSMDQIMGKLSGQYQDTSLNLIGKLISVIEPTIVCILCLLVGLVLLSVMIPLLGILSGTMA